MATDPATQGASSKKKWLIIGCILVLLLGGGIATFLLLNPDEEVEQQDPQEQAQLADSVEYVDIAQPFLFNVTGDVRNSLVQIKVQLMVRGIDNEALIRHHLPLVESTLLATFSSATIDQLRSTNGRTQLSSQATDDVKSSLTQAVGQAVIERVLFTDFVIQ